MQRRCGARLTRALVAGLLAVLGGFGATLATAPAAGAEEPEALVSIALTSIAPALPERDGDITLTGRVTNTSDERIFRPQAIFWRNQAPVTGREGLERVLESDADDPIGARQVDVYTDLYTAADPYLEPQASVDFRLTARVADLELSPTDGVYLMGVHVLQNGPPAVGRARVLVPVLADEPEASLRLTSLLLLSSRPSLVSPGVLSDEHLADEVGPGGRLTTLLAAAGTDDTSFAVDPELIEELTQMQAGYQVQGGGAGTGQADATRWLADFERLKDDHDGYRLLYGSPDIAALVHRKQQATLAAAAAAGDAVGSTRSLPLLVLPAEGAADQTVVEAAEKLDPAAILLSDTSTRTGTPLLVGPGEAPVVTFTAAAFDGGPGPDPRETPVHLQQRMLADSWVQASSADPGSTPGRVRLITSAAQAEGDDAADAPWIEHSTLSELLETEPTAWNQDYRYPDAAQEAELAPGQLDQVRRFTASQRTYADLLVDGAAARTAASGATARAASSFWRGRSADQTDWLQSQQEALDDVLQNQVQISSTRRVSTVAREGVEFPITVRNLLPASPTDPDANAVDVRLQFTSDNARRLRIDPIEFPLLRAQANSTENAQVTAKANGLVPVTAQLTTKSGLKIGEPVTIEVQVTQNGTTGWVIAIAAGIVLIGTTSLRIRQVTRERARAAGDPPPVATGDALSSAPPTDAAALHHLHPPDSPSGRERDPDV